MTKEFLQIKLKNGEYIVHELDDIEEVFITEIRYWYKEKKEKGEPA